MYGLSRRNAAAVSTNPTFISHLSHFDSLWIWICPNMHRNDTKSSKNIQFVMNCSSAQVEGTQPPSQLTRLLFLVFQFLIVYGYGYVLIYIEMTQNYQKNIQFVRNCSSAQVKGTQPPSQLTRLLFLIFQFLIVYGYGYVLICIEMTQNHQKIFNL